MPGIPRDGGPPGRNPRLFRDFRSGSPVSFLLPSAIPPTRKDGSTASGCGEGGGLPWEEFPPRGPTALPSARPLLSGPSGAWRGFAPHPFPGRRGTPTPIFRRRWSGWKRGSGTPAPAFFSTSRGSTWPAIAGIRRRSGGSSSGWIGRFSRGLSDGSGRDA